MSLFSRLNIFHRVRSWKDNVLRVLKALEKQNETMSSAIAELQAKVDGKILHYEQEIEGIREARSMLEKLQAQLVEVRDIFDAKAANSLTSDGFADFEPVQNLLDRLSKCSIDWELRFNRIELNHQELRDQLKLSRDLVAEFRGESRGCS